MVCGYNVVVVMTTMSLYVAVYIKIKFVYVRTYVRMYFVIAWDLCHAIITVEGTYVFVSPPLGNNWEWFAEVRIFKRAGWTAQQWVYENLTLH